jgi:hypothetical protein
VFSSFLIFCRLLRKLKSLRLAGTINGCVHQAIVIPARSNETAFGQMERGASLDLVVSSLSKRLEAEDLRHHGVKHAVRAVRVTTIFIAAAVAVFIAATEALPEIVVVVVLGQIITTIAVVRVPISIRVLVVGTPLILPVCLTGAEAFLVAVVYGLTEQVRAIFICLVVAAAAIVTVARSRVVVRITTVIVLTLVPKSHLLLTFTL